MVTKDIPSGVAAVGNPCRVMREINERDKDRKIGFEVKKTYKPVSYRLNIEKHLKK